MSRAVNANDLARILLYVENQAREVRATLEQALPEGTFVNDLELPKEHRTHWLECHVRDYRINCVLAALNWKTTPTTEPDGYVGANLVTEQSPTLGQSRRVSLFSRHRFWPRQRRNSSDFTDRVPGYSLNPCFRIPGISS